MTPTLIGTASSFPPPNLSCGFLRNNWKENNCSWISIDTFTWQRIYLFKFLINTNKIKTMRWGQKMQTKHDWFYNQQSQSRSHPYSVSVAIAKKDSFKQSPSIEQTILNYL